MFIKVYLLRLLRLLHLDELLRQAADLNKLEGLLAADVEDDAGISLLIRHTSTCRVGCDDVFEPLPLLHALVHCCSSIHCTVNNNCNIRCQVLTTAECFCTPGPFQTALLPAPSAAFFFRQKRWENVPLSWKSVPTSNPSVIIIPACNPSIIIISSSWP